MSNIPPWPRFVEELEKRDLLHEAEIILRNHL